MFGHFPRSQPQPSAQLPASSGRPDLFDAAIRIGLILAIFVVYAQVRHFEFVNYDDPAYVRNNAIIDAGFTPAGLKYVLTAVVAGNWTPVTMFSHMAACQFFGMNSGMHHLLNVLIHAMASLMLFAVLQRATGAIGASAFVAFIFALHPLRVESVVWIAERKDVLCAFFFFLALYAYLCYSESPSLRRYLLVAGAFTLALLSKPMAVTFPFVLLLFDVWPLRRAQFPKTLWEKLPLMALSVINSVITYLAQGSSDAVTDFPFGTRIDNVLISYVTYIGQMFWPVRLAWFYAYPAMVPAWQPACALAVLAGISALAIYTRAKYPYFLTGWLWYLGTLVPVIGLVQAGGQAHADRYTYIPTVGLLWIVAWGAVDLEKKWPRVKPVIATLAIACCVACMLLTHVQAGYWRNSIAVYQRGADVTEDNEWSLWSLARAQVDQAIRVGYAGNRPEAVQYLKKALHSWPNFPEARNELGVQLSNMPGHEAEAIAQFEMAVREDPSMAEAQRNLGVLLSSDPARVQDAIAHLRAAQMIMPDEKVQQLLDRLTGNAHEVQP